MTLSLVIQCVDTWDFSPVESDAFLFVNGVKFPHVAKKGGYMVLTKPLPDEFSLKILTKDYTPFEIELTELPKSRILLAELIPSRPPDNSKSVAITAPAIVVYGYNYYRITDLANSDKPTLKIKNPRFENIEGRRFLLRDTKNNIKEFIILGKAFDVKLSEYQIASGELKHNYNIEYSALFPAFKVVEPSLSKIYVKRDFDEKSIWFF